MNTFTCPFCDVSVRTLGSDAGHFCPKNRDSRNRPKLTNFLKESKAKAFVPPLPAEQMDELSEAESTDFPRYEVVADCRVAS